MSRIIFAALIAVSAAQKINDRHFTDRRNCFIADRRPRRRAVNLNSKIFKEDEFA
jgi:hypothetical protein